MDANPLPTEWNFNAAPGFVIARFDNPFCTGVFFVEVSSVDSFTDAMQRMKAKAVAMEKGTLEVPPQVLLGANGQPALIVPPSDEVQEHVRGLHLVDPTDEGAVGTTDKPVGAECPDCHCVGYHSEVCAGFDRNDPANVDAPTSESEARIEAAEQMRDADKDADDDGT